jgi:ribosome modulation factor
VNDESKSISFCKTRRRARLAPLRLRLATAPGHAAGRRGRVRRLCSLKTDNKRSSFVFCLVVVRSRRSIVIKNKHWELHLLERINIMENNKRK